MTGAPTERRGYPVSRFDPIPGKPYGECADCGVALQTQEDGREHMSATRPAHGQGSSHRIRVTNQPRADRIQAAVNWLVSDAIDESMEGIHWLVEHDGATAEEVADALLSYPDFADAYDEWVRS